MIEIPRHPNYRKNADRLHADDVPCVICGKAVKDQRFMFWTWEGAYLVTEAEVDAINAGTSDTGMTPAGDSGGYPIGAGCLKKHPELKPYLMTDEPLSETGEATAIVKALMVKARETGIVFEPAPTSPVKITVTMSPEVSAGLDALVQIRTEALANDIEELLEFDQAVTAATPLSPFEAWALVTGAESAPLDDETLGLVELAESVADGLESGDIVLIDDRPLTLPELTFMYKVKEWDGWVLYLSMEYEREMAERMEARGLVTIARGDVWWTVIPVRGEEE